MGGSKPFVLMEGHFQKMLCLHYTNGTIYIFTERSVACLHKAKKSGAGGGGQTKELRAKRHSSKPHALKQKVLTTSGDCAHFSIPLLLLRYSQKPISPTFPPLPKPALRTGNMRLGCMLHDTHKTPNLDWDPCHNHFFPAQLRLSFSCKPP